MRNYIDLINEAGVPTRDIHIAARKEMREALKAWANKVWNDAEGRYSDKEPSDLYDALSNDLFGRPEFVTEVGKVLSNALTKITRDHVRANYPAHLVPVDRLGVYVVHQKIGNDTLDSYRGYFSSRDTQMAAPKIVVNVEPDIVHGIGSGAVMLIAFGESEVFDNYLRSFMPTFTHEFAHLIQFLNGGYNALRDKGYINLDGVSSRRTPNKDTKHWLSYKASALEIDSFASSTATNIMDELLNSMWDTNADDGVSNETIGSILGDIATGYTNDDTYHGYLTALRAAFEGEFSNVGLDPNEMNVVWKRYLKILYSKLKDYETTKIGKQLYTNDLATYDKHWIAVSKRYPLPKTAGIVAMLVADSIYEDNGGAAPNLAHGLEYSSILTKGSQFIERAYFKEDWNFEKSEKIRLAFNNLVKKLYIKRYESDQHIDNLIYKREATN